MIPEDGIVAPSENEITPQAPVETVPEIENQDTEAKPEGDKPEGDQGKEKRPGRRERQLSRAQQEIAQLRAEMESLRSQSPHKPNTDAEPKLEDFEDAIEWSKAQSKWEAKQALEGYKAEQTKHQEQIQLQELVADHDEREEAFVSKVPDYEQKVTGLLQSGLVTPEIQVAVLHSEMSPEIAYHFASSEGGLNDLHILQTMQGNPRAMNAAIKQIESFIKANGSQPAVKTTQANAPISPVRAKTVGSTKSPADMTLSELDKYWKPVR